MKHSTSRGVARVAFPPAVPFSQSAGVVILWQLCSPANIISQVSMPTHPLGIRQLSTAAPKKLHPFKVCVPRVFRGLLGLLGLPYNDRPHARHGRRARLAPSPWLWHYRAQDPPTAEHITYSRSFGAARGVSCRCQNLAEHLATGPRPRVLIDVLRLVRHGTMWRMSEMRALH